MKYDFPKPRLTSSLTPMYRGNSYVYSNNNNVQNNDSVKNMIEKTLPEKLQIIKK